MSAATNRALRRRAKLRSQTLELQERLTTMTETPTPTPTAESPFTPSQEAYIVGLLGRAVEPQLAGIRASLLSMAGPPKTADEIQLLMEEHRLRQEIDVLDAKRQKLTMRARLRAAAPDLDKFKQMAADGLLAKIRGLVSDAEEGKPIDFEDKETLRLLSYAEQYRKILGTDVVVTAGANKFKKYGTWAAAFGILAVVLVVLVGGPAAPVVMAGVVGSGIGAGLGFLQDQFGDEEPVIDLASVFA